MILGAVALLVVAMAFVAAELFLPSHGLLAIFAGVAALCSVVMAYQANTELGLLFGVVILVATPVVFYWAIRIYPMTPVGKRVMLSPPRRTGAAGAGSAGEVGGGATAFEEESAKLEALVGRTGMAVTTLRPAGSVEVDGRRIDALSEAEVIAAGTPVEVVKVSGLKVFVKGVS